MGLKYRVVAREKGRQGGEEGGKGGSCQLEPEAAAFCYPVQGNGGALLQPVVVCMHLHVPHPLRVADGRSLVRSCLGGCGPHARHVRLRGCPACLAQDDIDEMLVIRPE